MKNFMKQHYQEVILTVIALLFTVFMVLLLSVLYLKLDVQSVGGRTTVSINRDSTGNGIVIPYGTYATGTVAVGETVPSRVDENGNLVFTGNKLSTLTSASSTVNSTSGLVMATSTTRQYLILVNDSDSIIYLSLNSPAVLGKGIRLNANGGSYEINSLNLITDAIYAISSANDKNLTIAYK